MGKESLFSIAPPQELLTAVSSQHYPDLWYMQKWALILAIYVVGNLGFVAHFILDIPVTLWTRGIVVLLFLLVSIFDIATTTIINHLKPAFDERDLEFPFVETNPLLPDEPTLKDQLSSKLLLVQGGGIVLMLVLPFIGLAGVVARGIGSYSNWRLYKRGRYQLDLHDRLSLRK